MIRSFLLLEQRIKPAGRFRSSNVQCDQLADPDAGGVQQLQHGMIPEALGVHALRLFQKQLHLFGW